MTKSEEEKELERLKRLRNSSYSSVEGKLETGRIAEENLPRADAWKGEQETKKDSALYVTPDTEQGRKIIYNGFKSTDPTTSAYFKSMYPDFYDTYSAFQTDNGKITPSGNYLGPSIADYDEEMERKEIEDKAKEQSTTTPYDDGILSLLDVIKDAGDSPSIQMPTYSAPAEAESKQYSYNPLTYNGYQNQSAIDNPSPWAGVDNATYQGAMAQYQSSEIVNAASQLTQQQLNKLMEGRTQYTDKLNSLIDAYGNRDKFDYDPNSDMLYQNYLTAMQNAGQRAMKDTMGQAAALTGGYGSTYATAAANGAYNNYLQTANDNLVNFYNMALDKYKLEGDEALQNINLVSMQDSTDWNRMVQEYEAAANRENTLYNRDRQEWADRVNQYNQSAAMQSNDYWRNKQNEMATDQFNSEMVYRYDSLNQSAYDNAQERALQNAKNEYSAAWDAYSSQLEQDNWQKEYNLDVTKTLYDRLGSNSASGSSDGSNITPTQYNKLLSEAASIAKEQNGEAALEYIMLNSSQYGYNLSQEQIQDMLDRINSANSVTYEKVEDKFGKKNDKYRTSDGRLVDDEGLRRELLLGHISQEEYDALRKSKVKK